MLANQQAFAPQVAGHASSNEQQTVPMQTKLQFLQHGLNEHVSGLSRTAGASDTRRRSGIAQPGSTRHAADSGSTYLERFAHAILRVPIPAHYFLAALIAAGFSVYRGNAGVLVVFLQGVVVTNALLLLMKEEASYSQRAYAIALSACSIVMLFTNVMFEWNYGLAAAANDELKFYYWIDTALWQQEWTGELFFARDRYLGYFYPAMFFLAPARAFGEYDPYFLKYISFFVCCLIPVLVYRLYRIYFSQPQALMISCLTTFLTPTVLYYGVVGVRDIFFTCSFLLFVLVMVARISTSLRLVLLAAIAAYIWFLRPESAMFLGAAIGLHVLVSGVLERSSAKTFAAISLGFLALAYVLYDQRKEETPIGDIVQVYSSYSSMALEHTRTEAAIRQLPPPLNWTLLASYGVLGTFPPELACRSDLADTGRVHVQDTDKEFLINPNLALDYGRGVRAIGQLIWYFVLAYVLYGLYRWRKLHPERIPLVALQYTGLCYLCAMSLFTFELGRLHAPYPLLVSFGIATFLLLRRSPVVRSQLICASAQVVLVLYSVYYFIRV